MNCEWLNSVPRRRCTERANKDVREVVEVGKRLVAIINANDFMPRRGYRLVTKKTNDNICPVGAKLRQIILWI